MDIFTEFKPFLFGMLREVDINPTDDQIKSYSSRQTTFPVNL